MGRCDLGNVLATLAWGTHNLSRMDDLCETPNPILSRVGYFGDHCAMIEYSIDYAHVFVIYISEGSFKATPVIIEVCRILLP